LHIIIITILAPESVSENSFMAGVRSPKFFNPGVGVRVPQKNEECTSLLLIIVP